MASCVFQFAIPLHAKADPTPRVSRLPSRTAAQFSRASSRFFRSRKNGVKDSGNPKPRVSAYQRGRDRVMAKMRSTGYRRLMKILNHYSATYDSPLLYAVLAPK
jgi:hypothetical protein